MRCVFESDITLKLVSDVGKLSFGDNCYVGRFTQFDILGECRIGNHVLIASGCTIIDHNHGLERSTRIDEQCCTVKPVRIADDVWLGANCVILPGVSIGTGAVIGACACVTKDVPEYAIMVGVPARVVGFRSSGSSEKSYPAEGSSLSALSKNQHDAENVDYS